MSPHFKIEKSRLVYEGKVITLVEEEVTNPATGGKHTYAVVTHPGAVVVLPQHADGRLVMIKQYRHAVRDFLLEFPAGTFERNETPDVCAVRELSEETGFGAKQWIAMGTIFPTPGFCNELQHFFLARDLFPKPAQADIDEVIETVEMSVDDVKRAIAEGVIKDAKTISIFARAFLRGHLDRI